MTKSYLLFVEGIYLIVPFWPRKMIEHVYIKLRERLECSGYFRMLCTEINDLHTLTL